MYMCAVCAGDAVVLERWTEDRTKLHLHIIKGKAQDLPAASSRITKDKSRRTARSAQRAKHAKPAHGSAAKKPMEQGYSPTRGTSGALEALHDAALLCASTLKSDIAINLHHQTDVEDANPNPNDLLDGHVSAAAVAAADAAALRLDASKLTHTAGLASKHHTLVEHGADDIIKCKEGPGHAL